VELFLSDREGDLGLWRVDVAAKVISPVQHHAQAGSEDAEGNLVFQATNQSGLWLKRANAEPIRISQTESRQEFSHRQNVQIRHHQGSFWVWQTRDDGRTAVYRFELQSGLRIVGVWPAGLDHTSQLSFASNGDILSAATVKSTELFWTEAAAQNVQVSASR
jgi:hypothetical protein